MTRTVVTKSALERATHSSPPHSSVVMPKRKRRPWLDDAVVDRTKARDGEKTAARKARERAFREKHPERFEEDREAAGTTDASTSERRDGDEGRGRADEGERRRRRRGGDGTTTSGRGERDGSLETVETDPRMFPAHAPCQTRDDVSEAEFERRRARVESLTREIGTCARHKQLRRACRLFVRMIASEGLVPSPYAYASLLNAYVNTGTMDGAEALMERMREVGCAPNVVAYTTMLKGYMLVADVDAAWRLIDGMTHPVAPDSRAVNTYIRVCVRCGNLRMARRAFERMRQWDVVPDDTTHKLMGRLLAQGLRCDELKKLIKSVRKGEHVRWTNDPNSGPCQFWRAGKCERGVNCRFYHDPSIAQSDALEKEIESNDTLASLYVNHAHASAVCGQFEQCAKSLDKAGECLTEDGGAGGLRDKDERAELFRRTNRDELKLEMQRVKAFAERVQKRKQEPPNLESHLSKTLIFSSQILEAPARESKMSSEEVDALRANLYAALKDTMGLVDSECSVKRAIRKCIADDGTMRFDRMFGRSKKDKREVNLEVAAGNGDWAVAQAKADDSADWISLELRHDRVYSIFSRAVCSGVSNFAAMGGDAAYVMRRNVAPESVSNVFVNFPEPPHHSGDSAADNSLALLNAEFFRDIHASLRAKGGLTIFSDNHRYMRSLATTLAELELFKAREDVDLSSREPAERYETVSGVRLYEGLPGPLTGHRVYEQSYFDRFWENGQHIDRYFITLVKL